MLLAHAHADVVTASLRRLLKARDRKVMQVVAVKLAHHGSRGNASDDLLNLLDSPNFVFSTNGAIFRHPDDETVQRVIARSVHALPTLCFNYRSARNKAWEPPAKQKQLDYSTRYSEAGGKSLVVAVWLEHGRFGAAKGRGRVHCSPASQHAQCSAPQARVFQSQPRPKLPSGTFLVASLHAGAHQVPYWLED